jgi:hypothetical protein
VFTADEIVDQEDLDEIGALAMGIAEFTAINNAGTAVGWAVFAIKLPNGEIGNTRHAIAWIGGEFFLVQQLLPEGSGWGQMVDAWDVNDAGQITGSGIDPAGNGVGYVLTSLPVCPVDINGDSMVDVVDLVEVITSWGACAAPCPADVNGDGVVDVGDLVAVVLGFGPCA